MSFSRRMAAAFMGLAIGSSFLLGSEESKAGSAGGIPILRIDVFGGSVPAAAGTPHDRAGTNGIVVLLFGLALNNNAQPACAAPNPFSMAFDASTPQGKAWLSLATSAMLAGKNVQVVGIGNTVVGSLSPCLNVSPILQMSGMVNGNVERMMQLQVIG